MKKMSGIDEVMVAFDGQPIINNGKPLTIKSALLNMIGSCRSNNGEEAIRIRNMGQDLFKSESDFVFEDAMLSTLKDAIDQNVPNFVILVMAPIAEKMAKLESFSPKEALSQK